MTSKEQKGRQVSQGCVGQFFFNGARQVKRKKNLERGRGKMVGTGEFYQTENTKIDFPIVFLLQRCSLI